MSLNLPAASRAAVQAARPSAKFAWMLRFHDDQDEERIVSDRETLVGPDGRSYNPFPFEVVPPVQSGEETPVLRVRAAVVTHEVVEHLYRAVGRPEPLNVDAYQIQKGVKKGDRHEALRSFVGYQVVSAVANESAVSVSVVSRNEFDKALPRHYFSPGKFPGLF